MDHLNYTPPQHPAYDQQQGTAAMNLYSNPENATRPAHRMSHEHDAGLVHHAFDYNQRAIPGLGFGGSQDDGHSGWLNNSMGPMDGPAAMSDLDKYSGVGAGNGASLGAGAPSHRDVFTADDELSDGELEDLYDPVADESLAQLSSHAPGTSGERPASYSPQISTIEADPNLDATPSNDMAPLTHHEQLIDMGSRKQAAATQKSSWGPDQLEKARGDARNAILRLWPLQVRYENYLENGIDKSLLQSLFRELGLNFETTPGDGLPSAAVKPPSPAHTAAGAHVEPSGPITSGDGKSESRKDRIARLLAATGSRQQTAPAATPPPAMTSESKPPPPAGKSIDKSKLIYEKMEALRKAREAKAEMSTREQQPQDDSPPTRELPSNGQQENMVVNEGEQEQRATNPSVMQAGRMLPVSLQSRSPPSAPRSMLQKRPVASDFLSQQQEPPPKRPFSQTDRSRPFLIDVSEDEDSDGDTAMDLDSPEQRPLTLRRNATGDSALRNYPPLSELPSNGRSTPNSGLGRSNTTHGKENLDKMQQNIEEMKKRIAEAEARKKARQSRQGTPLQSPANGRSEAGVASPASIAAEPSVQNDPASGSENLTQASEHDPLVQTGGTPGASGAGRPRLKRDLSRAAVERLAVIEADRKRQTLKMKILRAQLAQMEREMAASVEEEKALREDATPSPTPEQENSSDLPEQGGLPGIALPKQTSVEADRPIGSPETSRGTDCPMPTAVGSHAAAIAHPAQQETESSPERDASAVPSFDAVAADHVDAEVSPDADNVDMKDATPQDSVPELVNPEGGSMATLTSDAAAHGDALPRNAMAPPYEADEQSDDQESPPQSVDMESSTSEPDSESSQDADDSREPSTQSPKSPSPIAQRSPSATARCDEPSLVERETYADNSFPDPQDLGRSHAANDSSFEGAGHEEAMAEVDIIAPCPTAHSVLTTDQDIRPRADSTSSDAHKHTFRPYKSPLQYFHAYRFHPEYNSSVKGGLRSLTYSNMLDVRQQLCPEELLGQQCPRGKDCDFQHLGNIAAPDDHILMQLGSYGLHEGDQQEEFNRGLRKLLTEFRDQKVKDFQAISQAIIDYRTEFHKDRSRILPLGNVSL